jgi:YidC/Oxa1 family membrane protein insertase
MTYAPVLANVLQPIITVFEHILLALHSVVGSWGMAIISLTIVIRTLLLPLAVIQYKSMKNMAALQPEIKKLKDKYPDDPQAQQREQMALFKENGVNPIAGCLPILAQAPVLISLFYLLRKEMKIDICGQYLPEAIKSNAHALSKATCSQYDHGAGLGKFLFIPDLTAHGTGTVLIALIFLYVASQMISTLLMPSTVSGMQRKLFFLLPLLFVPFVIGFPTGLLVYWITTNLYTVIQQIALRRIYGAPGGVTTDESPIGIIEGVVTDYTTVTDELKAERRWGFGRKAPTPAAATDVAVVTSEKPKSSPTKDSGAKKPSNKNGSSGSGTSPKPSTAGVPSQRPTKRKRTGKRR